MGGWVAEEKSLTKCNIHQYFASLCIAEDISTTKAMSEIALGVRHTPRLRPDDSLLLYCYISKVMILYYVRNSLR